MRKVYFIPDRALGYVDPVTKTLKHKLQYVDISDATFNFINLLCDHCGIMSHYHKNSRNMFRKLGSELTYIATNGECRCGYIAPVDVYKDIKILVKMTGLKPIVADHKQYVAIARAVIGLLGEENGLVDEVE